MNYKRALTEEAVRLLDISDRPDLYHSLRRWAREHIKHETVAPIDTVNWPMGSLMCGLMHMAGRLQGADTSADRAVAILAMASVQNYLDRWIGQEAPLYTVDDALAAQALLSLAETYKTEGPDLYMHYMKVAGGVMRFLYEHDTDPEGVLPYRPAHKTGEIFADSCGMVLPFAVRYGLMKQDDDAIELGLRQITGVMQHMIDPETGLPWHVYTLDETGEVHHRGTPGWGRALGWIMYGLGGAVEAFDLYPPKTPAAIMAQKAVTAHLEKMSETAVRYRRWDGLFGSVTGDESSPADTSASAMIIYGLKRRDFNADRGVRRPDGEGYIEPILPYISSSGEVRQAQGECMDVGVYSDVYASYPWSVGMTMMLI